MLKKVKEIYFKEGMGLPIFVMQNGETKNPYTVGSTVVWLTNKEHESVNKIMAEQAAAKTGPGTEQPKKKWNF